MWRIGTPPDWNLDTSGGDGGRGILEIWQQESWFWWVEPSHWSKSWRITRLPFFLSYYLWLVRFSIQCSITLSISGIFLSTLCKYLCGMFSFYKMAAGLCMIMLWIKVQYVRTGHLHVIHTLKKYSKKHGGQHITRVTDSCCCLLAILGCRKLLLAN